MTMNLFKIARTSVIILVASTLIAASANADKKKAKTVSPPLVKSSGKLIFTRTGDNVNEGGVWSANLDGTGERELLAQIFKPDSGNIPLVLSPDGKRVIYSHNPRNLDAFTGEDLFDIRLDGTGKRRLTDTRYMLYSRTPRYSPNGKQIVYARFTGYRMGGPGYTDAEIRIMNADGSNDHRLVGDLTDVDHNDYNPFWSKDGKAILFSRTNWNMDYGSYDGFKLTPHIISIDGKTEREFHDKWNRFSKFVNPSEKEQLAAKLGDSFRVGLIVPEAETIILSATQSTTRKHSDGLMYSETGNSIWRSKADGSNARKLISNAQIVGIIR